QFICAKTGRKSMGKCLVDTGPVLERDWAHRAGLGFTGKNCCTINPALGSWLFLATIMVAEKLKYDELQPMESLALNHTEVIRGLSRETNFGSWQIPDVDEVNITNGFNIGTCGGCTRCLSACPTDAFIGPFHLDPRRCISYWTIETRSAIPRELRALFA